MTGQLPTKTKVAYSSMNGTLKAIDISNINSGPFSLRFPFRMCDLQYLKDTKKSVRTGVRHSVRDYHDSEMIKFISQIDTSNKSIESSDNYDEFSNESNRFDDETDDTELEVNRPIYYCHSPSPAKECMKFKPIIKLIHNQKQKDNISLLVARNKINELIAERFDSVLLDPNIQDLKNYVINKIVLSFPVADINPICSKIIAKSNQSALCQIVDELFIEKYTELKLDSFYDSYIFSISKFSPEEYIPWYKIYKEIWQFDNEDYVYNDYTQFQEENLSFSEFSDSNQDFSLLNLYFDRAFLLNLEKFYFYYSFDIALGLIESMERKVDRQGSPGFIAHFDEKRDLLYSRDFSHSHINDNHNSNLVFSNNKKLLRFSNSLDIIDVDQSEPSYTCRGVD